MVDADKKQFLVLMTAICEYYGKEASIGVIQIYWEGLKQYDLQAVSQAMWNHAKNPDNGQFMPKIADIARGLQGRTVDQGSIAWAKVDRAVRTVGTYADVVFDDPLIHRVIQDMGGWIKLGQADENEWPFIEKRFVTAYQGYRMRSEQPAYPDRLIGMANAQNQVSGQPMQPPRLLGDQDKAKHILLSGETRPAEQMRQIGNLVDNLKG